MNLNIESEEENREIAELLNQLAADLVQYHDLAPQMTTISVPSEKFVDLVTAIALSNLALSMVALVIDLLKYKAETNPNMTVAIKDGDRTIELKNASKADIDAFLKTPRKESVRIGIRTLRD